MNDTYFKEKKDSNINTYLLAIKGDPEAQFVIGRMYYTGGQISRNLNEAMKWFLLSANQGHVASPFYIGSIYYSGVLGSPNYKEAFKWFLLSANKGYQQAKYNVGKMYDLGLGVEQDIDAAIFWYKEGFDYCPKSTAFKINRISLVINQRITIFFEN